MKCKSSDVIRHGATTSGKQRWRCLSCNHTFTRKNKANKVNQEKVWFDQWVAEGYSVRQLVSQSGYSQVKIRNIIRYWLDHPPTTEAALQDVKHLVIDGTFLVNRIGILVVMDASNHSVISGKYGVAENSDRQVTGFLERLKDLGLDPVSCATDGNPQVIKVVSSLWSEVTMQRCIVHVQRQGLMWCRRFPKRTDVKRLRELFLQVTLIDCIEERDRFLTRLSSWEDRYGKHIQSSREKGRVASDVKRARSMLVKAVPNMFHFLNNPCIPKSTNGLEGYFSRLKHRYRQHRGLSQNRRSAYFSWYFLLRKR